MDAAVDSVSRRRIARFPFIYLMMIRCSTVEEAVGAVARRENVK